MPTSPVAASHPWHGRVGSPGEESPAWAALAEAVERSHIHTPRTSSVCAQDWAARMRTVMDLDEVPASHWGVRDTPPRALSKPVFAVEAGLALADLYALAPAMSRDRDTLPNGAVRAFVATTLWNYDGLSLRAAVGWTLVGLADPTVAPFGEPYESVWWQGAGFGEDGWLYKAAGLTGAEALAAAREGALVREEMVTLAALRGVPLPVGVGAG